MYTKAVEKNPQPVRVVEKSHSVDALYPLYTQSAHHAHPHRRHARINLTDTASSSKVVLLYVYRLPRRVRVPLYTKILGKPACMMLGYPAPEQGEKYEQTYFPAE
ncbi:Uncharacterised protein [Rothia aeria]|uniref:Uncharacterized protein n=1 Tax=Rothia aeria TaxID=172042 RepID=A0A7Z9A5H3_9MICC|nr:Uncharacterised protein [Rothia aeria]